MGLFSIPFSGWLFFRTPLEKLFINNCPDAACVIVVPILSFFLSILFYLFIRFIVLFIYAKGSSKENNELKAN